MAETPRTAGPTLQEQLAAAVALSRSMSGRRATHSPLFHGEVSRLDRFLDALRDNTYDARVWTGRFFKRHAEKIGIALMTVATLATIGVVVGHILSSSAKMERPEETTKAADSPKAQKTRQKPRERPVLRKPPPSDSPP